MSPACPLVRSHSPPSRFLLWSLENCTSASQSFLQRSRGHRTQGSSMGQNGTCLRVFLIFSRTWLLQWQLWPPSQVDFFFFFKAILKVTAGLWRPLFQRRLPSSEAVAASTEEETSH